VHNNLGFAYLLYDNYNAAIDAFQKAIALNDQNKRFHNNLGLAYAKKGQFDLAIEQFRLTGDEFSANYRLGQILYREGNYQMALQYNEKAHHAKTSAQIMSSVSSSDKEKGPDAVLQVEEKSPESKSSVVSSDYARTSLKRDEKKPVAGMSGLSKSKKEYKVPADENSNTKPVTQKNEDLMKVTKREDRKSNKIIVEVEIEISNGNGVNGMAKRLGNYLRKKGFKVTRLTNANCFNHAKTKIFYYNGYIQDVHRLLQEIRGHQDISHVIELKHLGNRIKILIGKDMTPFDEVISKAYSTKHTS
jgi:tetratricopeptide (TPR) repeat protein